MLAYIFFFLNNKNIPYIMKQNEWRVFEDVELLFFVSGGWIDKSVKVDPEFYAQFDERVENSFRHMTTSNWSEWKLRAWISNIDELLEVS